MAYEKNKMGTMPVPKLLFSMSAPIIISMMIQALYNIVDSIFVAAVSGYALTAVSLVFPVQLLLIAVATGTGTGISAILALNLGKNEVRAVHHTVQNSLFISLMSFIVIGLTGFFVARIFVTSQTSVEYITGDSISYMRIICAGSIFYFFSITFERLLQATGRPAMSMYMQFLGAAVNLILDPLLIFGLLGFPHLGVTGAAIATITGQAASMVLGIILNIKVNPDISLSMSGFFPDAKIIGQIYKVGLPSIFVQVAGSLTTFIFNSILLKFTAESVAVYGICTKLQNFVFMPVYGLSNTMIPVITYNRGAAEPRRVRQTVFCGTAAAIAITACGTLLFNAFPDQLISLFSAGENMSAIGVYALAVFSLSSPFCGYCTICNSIFQAMEKSSYSIVLSVLKQFVLLLPAAYLLAGFRGLNAVWWSFLIAEAIAACLAFILCKRIY